MATETRQTSLLRSPSSPGVSDAPGTRSARPPRGVPWIGLTLAVALLAVSGVVRAWQSWGVNELLRQGRQSPFPLASLPRTLGDWEGEALKVDPEIAQATGCTDSVFRSYRNTKTGSRIDLILLYGPTLQVVRHSPVICYPTAGFSWMAQPSPRTISIGKMRFPFSSMAFTKGAGDQAIHEEVYYTWGAVTPGRPGVRWAPEVGSWKQVQRIPGLYKVHLERDIRPQERREFGNPCESFLTELMPWIDNHYNASVSAPKPPKSPRATPTGSRAGA